MGQRLTDVNQLKAEGVILASGVDVHDRNRPHNPIADRFYEPIMTAKVNSVLFFSLHTLFLLVATLRTCCSPAWRVGVLATLILAVGQARL